MTVAVEDGVRIPIYIVSLEKKIKIYIFEYILLLQYLSNLMVNSSVVSAYNMDDYCYILYNSLGMDYRENMSKTACLKNNNNKYSNILQWTN